MKFSETPDDLKSIRKGYIDARWRQLSEAASTHGEEAIKYLLIVNVAALGAALGFLGAMPHLRPLDWPRWILVCFALGVAILGAYHAVRYHRTEWLFRNWRAESNKYGSNDLHWNDLIDADIARTKWLVWLQALLAYVSLFSFYAGLGIAIWNFDQVATIIQVKP